VKFTIVPQSDGSQKVYFQDGHAYPFHYQAAVKHLDQFAGMTTEQFERARAEGCTEVQGFLIGAPRPLRDAMAVLKRARPATIENGRNARAG